MPDRADLDNHCPYVGLFDDPDTYYSFPTDGNHCHLAYPVEPVSLTHQSTTCLTPGFASCLVYKQGQDRVIRLPRSLRWRSPLDRGRRRRRVVLFFTIVLVVLSIVTVTVVTMRTSLTVAVSELSQTLAALVPATVTPTPSQVPSPLPLPTQTPTLTLTPTAIQAPLPATPSLASAVLPEPLVFTLPSDGAPQCVPFVLVMPARFEVVAPDRPIPSYGSEAGSGSSYPAYRLITSGAEPFVEVFLQDDLSPGECDDAGTSCATVTLSLCAAITGEPPVGAYEERQVATLQIGVSRSGRFEADVQVDIPVVVRGQQP